MAKASNEYNVADAGIIIDELTTIEDVKAFIEGDTRKGVLAAAEAKIAELTHPAGNQGGEAPKKEKPVIDPRWDKNQQQIMGSLFHTINILKDKDEPDYAPVNCAGTRPDGSEFEIRLKVMRGVDVPNVPREAVMVLYGAITIKHREVPKGGLQGGKRLVPYQEKRFPIQIKDSYDEKKAE